jgi:hypothetical protein
VRLSKKTKKNFMDQCWNLCRTSFASVRTTAKLHLPVLEPLQNFICQRWNLCKTLFAIVETFAELQFIPVLELCRTSFVSVGTFAELHLPVLEPLQNFICQC